MHEETYVVLWQKASNVPELATHYVRAPERRLGRLPITMQTWGAAARANAPEICAGVLSRGRKAAKVQPGESLRPTIFFCPA
ncbi:hypothetical protein CBM2614_B160065 [Cupriavidus taiwanensis]|nr:hypothetical protein CBM2614_B160065 [Cupriavidus taiwanensis]